MHSFDEFLGGLYCLNAEEEPENLDYPKNPEFLKKFGPRGVLHTKADGCRGQTIENTGRLTKTRLETIEAAQVFIARETTAGKPWFVWWDGIHMHVHTHVKAENRGKSRQDEYSDGMVEHDTHSGTLRKTIDDLSLADTTIVMYPIDNGQIVAAGHQRWKITFLESRDQAFGVLREPFVELRAPLISNLRRDPFEKA